MEQGAFGLDIGMTGYPNGASYAYCIYLIMFLVAYKLSAKSFLARIKIKNKRLEQSNAVNKRLIRATVFNLVILIIMLFVFGGYKVWMGIVDKGDFRSSFGFFGPIAYYVTLLVSPSIMAYITCFRSKLKSNKTVRAFWLLNICLTLIIGSTWGFKSTSITMLIPTIIIYYQKVSIKSISIIGGSAFTLLVFFSVIFDGGKITTKDILALKDSLTIEATNDITKLNPLTFVVYRLTVMQGNSAWKVWDVYYNNQPLPDYSKFLVAIIGDKALSTLGLLDSPKEINDYHFADSVTTLVQGRSSFGVKQKTNVTATAFADGVILGGYVGIMLVGFFAGFMARSLKDIIFKSYLFNNHMVCCLATVYFSSYFLPWLNGGGITTLFHISILVGLIFTYCILLFINNGVKVNQSKIKN